MVARRAIMVCPTVLHNFITERRDQITDRASVLSRARDPLLHSDSPTEEVSAFLTQVSTALRQGKMTSTHNAAAINSTAGRNGARMLRAGHPIMDVVQAYGDLCQAVTALAAESRVPISAADFCVFNRCLDDAIGHAVSEYNRVTEETRSVAETQRLGFAAHELRDQLQTARLSLASLKSSGEPVEGLSGQLLDRALVNLSELIERTLSDVRLAAGVERREAVELAPFLHEVGMTAELHAQSRGVTCTIDSDTTGSVEADRPLLMSAVMNLVHNALKFTNPGGNVRVTVRTSSTRLSIAVEDQCGGIADSARGVFTSFTDRRGAERSGLGLGLSIAKQVIRAHNGDIKVRNLPGVGCVFTIDIPLVAPKMHAARSRRAE
jgi:signal transduction histidine kinase